MVGYQVIFTGWLNFGSQFTCTLPRFCDDVLASKCTIWGWCVVSCILIYEVRMSMKTVFKI